MGMSFFMDALPFSPSDFRLEDFQNAQKRLKSQVLRTPLVLLNSSYSEKVQIYLKLENLQPIGSFKLRGALNVVQSLQQEDMQNGVFTASAGNFAQGLAHAAQKLGVRCDVIMPDHAPSSKIEATERLGAKVTKVPFDMWLEVLQNHTFPGMKGKFLHPVSNKAMIEGNGTIGLEIAEELPLVDSVIVPFGGGALSSGVALAMKAVNPKVKVYVCEVETAAPFSASLTAGEPVTCSYQPSFVDGIGAKFVLKEMWPLTSTILDGSIVVTLKEVSNAVRLLAERNHVIAEGAGAAAVAAALSGKAGGGCIACVVSGGNINISTLVQILNGDCP